MAAAIPVTEETNCITENIDVAIPQDIPILLCKCDQEILMAGKLIQISTAIMYLTNPYNNISSQEITAVIREVTKLAGDVFKNPDENGIVLSGCGTSGRLAFFIARSFNAALKKLNKSPCVEYLIAGGDRALFTSQEAPEDRHDVGMQALVEVCANRQWKHVLFVGITCGLSAPYVAGQLDHCIDHLDYFTPVVLGFNPINLARDNPIEGWDKTFRQTATRMQQLQTEGRAFVLNPVVGPEAITGSSRMKGGSATKILLELIFWTGLMQATEKQSPAEGGLGLLKLYQRVLDTVRQHSHVSTECIKLTGKSLNSGGHVYYIASNNLGVLAIIDASECPPTYGATHEDVRGFIMGGYGMYGNSEGDISTLGEEYQISTDHFKNSILPRLKANDTVIFLLNETNDEMDGLATSVTQQCPDVTTIGLQFIQPTQMQSQDSQNVFHYFAKISLPWDDILEDIKCTGITSWSEPHAIQAAQFAVEMTVKWTLNSISTGAHIMKGKVYKNFMVDLKLSNSKLFHRGIGIVQRFAKCSHEVARLSILRALYGTDDITQEVNDAPVSHPNIIATDKDKIIPTALLLAIQQCSIDEAKNTLLKAPVIREAIARLCDQ
ncbi:glucokinase regulatory protein-like [Amphiura filiformis]|uniref:glucokinase regulatory protein-like n=1 Tax=Amphiura filiformis TaxID=82378 RepID=UPI003B225CE5